MCIEYNKCHYGGMYNVYVKEFLLSMDTTSVVVLLCIKRKIFIITEIVYMNAGVSYEKEKVKESQSRSVTPPLDIHFGCQVGGVTPSKTGNSWRVTAITQRRRAT